MKKLLGIVAFAAVVAAAPAHATNGMRLTGFGPVQQSMGGASVAAPLDAVTAVTNPAGLSLLAPQIEVAGAAFSPTVKYDIGGQGATSSRPTDFLPTLAAAFRANDAITVGVAALGTAGMGVDYKDFGGPGAEMMSSYLNGRIAPAVAYKVNDQLSAGLALNLMYAQMKFAFPTPAGEVQPPSASSMGYGATIGVTYAPTAAISIGAAYETQSYFGDFSFDVGGGQTMKVKLDQPMVGTLGVAVKPVEGLLIALDGQWINWSAVLGKNKPETTPADQFNMNWADQFVVKVGAEYQIPALKELKVRAGLNYGKTPVDKEQASEALLFPAIAELHASVGAGYDIGKLTVNASFMYSPEANVSGNITVPTPGGPVPM
ncbi:MAG TPA: outer membrane protein transport protein, partial [Anaeromyxobacter sp.]